MDKESAIRAEMRTHFYDEVAPNLGKLAEDELHKLENRYFHLTINEGLSSKEAEEKLLAETGESKLDALQGRATAVNKDGVVEKIGSKEEVIKYAKENPTKE